MIIYMYVYHIRYDTYYTTYTYLLYIILYVSAMEETPKNGKLCKGVMHFQYKVILEWMCKF